MSTIQFGGVVSGLNTQGIIDAMMAVEQQPLTALQTKEANLTAQQTAYNQLGGALDGVISSLKAFTVTSAGASHEATSGNSSVFTATASPSAIAGQYQISVDHLATATRATSTGALGSALAYAVDPSKNLSALNLATPITAGQMTITVDGIATQVAVGNPASTTLQTLISGIATSLQTQLQTSDGTATVSANVVGGQLQLQVSGGSVAHTISFGDTADTSNAATALGLAGQGVNGATNPTITGSADLDPTIASLNLPGSITGGQISAIVDGTIVHYTVGDPTKTTFQQLMNGLGSAIQAQLRSGGANAGADAGATVGISVVNNRLQIAVTGTAANHSLSFGSAGDTSNALGILGIDTASVTNASNPTLSGATNLGVVRMSSALDQAGLTGLTSTNTGVLTINGVAISYDTTADSLSTVITRINNSSAGVVASLDRTNDKLIITRKDTGALAIDVQDTTGTLGAALKLAPGTTNAQQLGQSAQVTVDGRTVTSASNRVTNAIDGVALNLLSQSTTGTTTLTVGVDANAISSALSSFVSSFNALGDLLDKLTQQTPGTPGQAGSSGPLASDPTAQTMFLDLRSDLLNAIPGFSGSVMSLGDIGISTGSVGAAVGTTTRLQLDSNKLTAALNSDPNAVARLLDSSTGALQPIVDRLTAFESPGSTTSYVQAHAAGLGTEITSLKRQEADMQDTISSYQAALEAKYAAMEATLAALQSQSSQLAATSGVSMSSSTGTQSSSGSSK